MQDVKMYTITPLEIGSTNANVLQIIMAVTVRILLPHVHRAPVKTIQHAEMSVIIMGLGHTVVNVESHLLEGIVKLN
jgi:hypothetical protein